MIWHHLLSHSLTHSLTKYSIFLVKQLLVKTLYIKFCLASKIFAKIQLPFSIQNTACIQGILCCKYHILVFIAVDNILDIKTDRISGLSHNSFLQLKTAMTGNTQ